MGRTTSAGWRQSRQNIASGKTSPGTFGAFLVSGNDSRLQSRLEVRAIARCFWSEPYMASLASPWSGRRRWRWPSPPERWVPGSRWCRPGPGPPPAAPRPAGSPSTPPRTAAARRWSRCWSAGRGTQEHSEHLRRLPEPLPIFTRWVKEMAKPKLTSSGSKGYTRTRGWLGREWKLNVDSTDRMGRTDRESNQTLFI